MYLYFRNLYGHLTDMMFRPVVYQLNEYGFFSEVKLKYHDTLHV